MAAASYEVGYVEDALKDLEAMRPFDQRKISEAVEVHLEQEPTKVSKSRIKKMTQPFWSQYRLRVEDFRVYYDVNELKKQVLILRILEKGQKPTPKEPDHETT